MLRFLLNLQLFGEGGDGGSAGEGTAGETTGESLPSGIPDRAKKNYEKALAKHQPSVAKEVQPTNEPKSDKLSYADLIKSEDYKADHQAYMEKTISDRLKKYKGMEEESAKMRTALETVANKYGIDVNSETFLDDLSGKIEADDSFYEDYAMKHDMSPEEARKVVTMERQMQRFEAEKAERAKQEQMQRHIMTLRQNAEKTKAQFPDFNLEAEMQDERFRRLCMANNGDTTAAYMACHWNEIIPRAVNVASRQAQTQAANAVAANRARPSEAGLSSTSSSVVDNDFRNMDLKQLRAYADEQRRRKSQGR
jgi:hypothetical protein